MVDLHVIKDEATPLYDVLQCHLKMSQLLHMVDFQFNKKMSQPFYMVDLQYC